jgi:RHS repeat-associated protein
VKTRSYSLTAATPPNYLASPDVTYFYDGTGMPADVTATPAFSKGKLTAVQSAVSNTIYTEFDAVGHITKHRQVVDPGTTVEQSYLMEYSYNLAGGLISEKYPSGRIVATEYDSAGRTAGVKNTASGLYYAGGAPDSNNRLQYTAHGAVKDMRLGNGLWEHTLFNNRLQPDEIGLGTTKGSIDLLKLAYTYNSGTSTTDNNGNVQSQTITVPTITVPTIGTVTGYTATQSYTYDALNRLQSMTETGGLSQTFDYDRYGNRLITAGFVQDSAQAPHHLTASDPTISDWYDQNSNQLKTAKYDAGGNVVKDTAGTNPGNTFDYDGENHQVSYQGGNLLNGGATYSYDGDGRRVKKVTASGTTIFVYDAQGQMVAEYTTATQQGSGGTSYLTADSLGTPRVITDASGNVKARHDYFPFGEEVSAGVGGRTASQGYVVDSVRQKFTSAERDDESGLDFMQARYYSNTQGRFTSVDPLPSSGRLEIPQSLNRYTYALNNPLMYTDSTGLDWYIDKDRNVQWFKKGEQPSGFDPFTPKDNKYNISDTQSVILSPNGPDSNAQPGTDAFNGWSYGPHITDSSGASSTLQMAGVAVSVQPEGDGEIVAAGLLLYALYQWATHQPVPIANRPPIIISQPPPLTLPAPNPALTDPMQAKKSKSSGADRATDIPSWAAGEKPLPGESGREFAERVLEKYGRPTEPRGPGSEFNKLKIWG